MITNKKVFFNNKDPFRRHFKIKRETNINDLIIEINESKFFQEKHFMTSVIEYDTAINSYNNATLFPVISTNHMPISRIFEHLAYDENLNYISLADHYKYRYRGYTDHPLLPCFPYHGVDEYKVIPGDSYYMGILNLHYGHFILESLTRYWGMIDHNNENKEIKYVFHCYPGVKKHILHKLFSGYHKHYLNSLNLYEDNILIIDTPHIFENITIPQTSISLSDVHCYVSSSAKKVWDLINAKMAKEYQRTHQASAPERVYISRSHVSSPIQGRKLVNELEVEKLFSDLGFYILIPEKLESEFEKQFLLSGAKIIAGCPGSGLLSSVFAPSGASIISLYNEKAYGINPGLNHQIQTDKICGHKSILYHSHLYTEDNGIKWSIDISDLFEKLQSHKII